MEWGFNRDKLADDGNTRTGLRAPRFCDTNSQIVHFAFKRTARRLTALVYEHRIRLSDVDVGCQMTCMGYIDIIPTIWDFMIDNPPMTAASYAMTYQIDR